MRSPKNILRATACLLAAAATLAPPARANSFTAFAEDENICRQAGTDAIKGADGPTAAQHYDAAYGKCMATHGRMRMWDAYRKAAQPPYAIGTPQNSQYPDAFYSVPYATPGYGYDGFSP